MGCKDQQLGATPGVRKKGIRGWKSDSPALNWQDIGGKARSKTHGNEAQCLLPAASNHCLSRQNRDRPGQDPTRGCGAPLWAGKMQKAQTVGLPVLQGAEWQQDGWFDLAWKSRCWRKLGPNPALPPLSRLPRDRTLPASSCALERTAPLLLSSPTASC